MTRTKSSALSLHVDCFVKMQLLFPGIYLIHNFFAVKFQSFLLARCVRLLLVQAEVSSLESEMCTEFHVDEGGFKKLNFITQMCE
jgi:hypothetical protein